jgi:hypothetical protein
LSYRYEHVRERLVAAPLKRVDQIEDRPVVRDKGRPRKTTGKSFKSEFVVNDLFLDKLYDKTLWHQLIHVAGPT